MQSHQPLKESENQDNCGQEEETELRRLAKRLESEIVFGSDLSGLLGQSGVSVKQLGDICKYVSRPRVRRVIQCQGLAVLAQADIIDKVTSTSSDNARDEVAFYLNVFFGFDKQQSELFWNESLVPRLLKLFPGILNADEQRDRFKLYHKISFYQLTRSVLELTGIDIVEETMEEMHTRISESCVGVEFNHESEHSASAVAMSEVADEDQALRESEDSVNRASSPVADEDGDSRFFLLAEDLSAKSIERIAAISDGAPAPSEWLRIVLVAYDESEMEIAAHNEQQRKSLISSKVRSSSALPALQSSAAVAQSAPLPKATNRNQKKRAVTASSDESLLPRTAITKIDQDEWVLVEPTHSSVVVPSVRVSAPADSIEWEPQKSSLKQSLTRRFSLLKKALRDSFE